MPVLCGFRTLEKLKWCSITLLPRGDSNAASTMPFAIGGWILTQNVKNKIKTTL